MTIVEHGQAWCATTPKRVADLTNTSGAALKSVSSALDVLECFAVDGELGVSDIARRLGVAKSTAHRLLQTLASRGFVEQDSQTGHYRLGIHLYELGQLSVERHELRHLALPTLRQVAAATNLTVNFGVADGPDVVFVERIENPDGVRFLGHVGRRFPAHVTSSGKVLAAYNPAVADARLLAGFPPRTAATQRSIRTGADWLRCLEQVRRQGYAEAHHESFVGASSIAVPVLIRRKAIASVSVFGACEVIEPKIDKLVPLLSAASRRIALAYERH